MLFFLCNHILPRKADHFSTASDWEWTEPLGLGMGSSLTRAGTGIDQNSESSEGFPQLAQGAVQSKTFANGFLNDFLGATRSSKQDNENWAPRRGLWQWQKKERQIRVEVFETCFPWGNSGTVLHSDGSCICLCVVGSIPCQVTLSHDVSFATLLLPNSYSRTFPCLAPPVGITSLGMQGQVPDSGVAQNFVAFEECHIWDLQLRFLKHSWCFSSSCAVVWHCWEIRPCCSFTHVCLHTDEMRVNPEGNYLLPHFHQRLLWVPRTAFPTEAFKEKHLQKQQTCKIL